MAAADVLMQIPSKTFLIELNPRASLSIYFYIFPEQRKTGIPIGISY